MQCLFWNGITTYIEIGGIHVNNGIMLIQVSFMELFHMILYSSGDIWDRCRCIGMTIHLLDQITDFWSGNSFRIKLQDRCFQITRIPFIRFDCLLFEFTIAISWYLNLDITIAGRDGTSIVSISGIACIVSIRIVRFIIKEIGQFRFQKEIETGFNLWTNNLINWWIGG